MKKQLLTIATLVAAVFATGCSEADITETVGAEKKSQIEITVVADDSTESRTQITEGKVAWNADDCLFLAYRCQGTDSNFVTASATSEKVAINGDIASFTAQLTDPNTYGCDKVTCGGIVPAGAVTSCEDAAMATVTVPAAQTAAAGDIDHNADIMIMKPKEVIATEIASPISSGFRHIVAINKLVLTGMTADEIVQSVTVTAEDKALAGNLTVDLTTDDVKVSETTQPTITVNYEAAAAVNAEGTFDVWFASLPATIAEGEELSVDVVTSACTYSKTVAARAEGILFKEAYINTTTISMEKGDVNKTYNVFAKGLIGSRKLFTTEFNATAVAKAFGLETIDGKKIEVKGLVGGELVAPVQTWDSHFICFNADGTKAVEEGDGESRIFVEYYENGPLQVRPTGNCTEPGLYTCSVALVYEGKTVVFNITMEAVSPSSATFTGTPIALQTVTVPTGTTTLTIVTYDTATVAQALGMESFDVNKVFLTGYVDGTFVTPIGGDGKYISFDANGKVIGDWEANSRLFVDNYDPGTLRVRPSGDGINTVGTYNGSVALLYEGKAVVFNITLNVTEPEKVTVKATYTTIPVTVTLGDKNLVKIPYDAAAVATALEMGTLDVNKVQFKGKIGDEFFAPTQTWDSHFICFNADGSKVVGEGDADSRLFVNNYTNGFLEIRPTDNGMNIAETYTGDVAFVYGNKAVVFKTKLIVREVPALEKDPAIEIKKTDITVANADWSRSAAISLSETEISDLEKALGLENGEDILKMMFPNRYEYDTTKSLIRYGGVQTDNTISYLYDANGYGFWYNADGYVTLFANNPYMYIESDLPTAFNFYIGLSPNRNKAGDSHTITIAFVYGSQWAKIEFSFSYPAETTTETAQ